MVVEEPSNRDANADDLHIRTSLIVAGSGLVLEDIGEHEVKGVPERWRLSRAADA